MKLLDQINNLNLSPQANKILIEFFIERYKGVREENEFMAEQNKNKEKEIQDIELSLDNVSNLIKTKERIDQEIKRFGDIASENERMSQVASIKHTRLNYVFQMLKRIKLKANRKFAESLDQNDRSFLVGKGVLASIFVIFISSIGYYFVKEDSRLLTLGFVGLFLNLIAFIMINIFNNIDVNMVEGLGIDYSSNETSTYETLITKLDKNQELFLVNSAWITALEKEMQNISESIDSKLNGFTYAEILRRREALNNEIEANNLALSNTSQTIMSAEDYLSLRRELDILSIELEDENISEENVTNELKELHVENVANLSESFRKLLTLAQAKFHFSVS